MASYFPTAMLKAKELYQLGFGQENKSHFRYTNRKGFTGGNQRLQQLKVQSVKVRGEASRSSESQDFTCQPRKISAL